MCEVCCRVAGYTCRAICDVSASINSSDRNAELLLNWLGGGILYSKTDQPVLTSVYNIPPRTYPWKTLTSFLRVLLETYLTDHRFFEDVKLLQKSL